jgi:hypothetical protein
MSRSVETIARRLLDELIAMYGLDGLSKILRQQPTIDERLTKLTKIQEDLGDALKAVTELQKGATTAKKEADRLDMEVSRLRQDKAVAEQLVKVPDDAFARLLTRASAKGRGRGVVEGFWLAYSTAAYRAGLFGTSLLSHDAHQFKRTCLRRAALLRRQVWESGSTALGFMTLGWFLSLQTTLITT